MKKEVPRRWLLGSTAGDLCLDSRVAGLPIPTREDGSQGGLTGHVEQEWQWDCDLVHPYAAWPGCEKSPDKKAYILQPLRRTSCGPQD